MNLLEKIISLVHRTAPRSPCRSKATKYHKSASVVDKRYRRIVETFDVNGRQENVQTVAWIKRRRDSTQGAYIVACLELHLSARGPLSCHSLFQMLTTEIKQLQTIILVEDEQMARFFATYVQVLRKPLNNYRGQDLASDACPEPLRYAIQFLIQFWGYCPHIHDNPRRRTTLFQNTIAKLDVSEFALCLWVFVAVAADSEGVGDRDLCDRIAAELNVRAFQ
ncbi:MAG: hypothetical protein Q9210_003163 [Variospora velana]